MHIQQLKDILREYPQGRLLRIVAERVLLREITVAEMVLDLTYAQIKARPGDRDALLFMYFGRENLIVRERGEWTDDVAGAAPWRDWVELDLR